MAVEVYGAGGTEKTKQTKTVTPSTSLQTVTPDSEDYELEKVNVQAMPAGLMSEITVSTSGLITSKIGTSGYLAQNTSKTKQLSTVAAQSYMPGTEDREIIASGKYTTGSQKVKGDANLLPENIAFGKDIFGIIGSFKPNYTWKKYNYIGTVTMDVESSGNTLSFSNSNYDLTSAFIISDIQSFFIGFCLTEYATTSSMFGLWNSSFVAYPYYLNHINYGSVNILSNYTALSPTSAQFTLADSYTGAHNTMSKTFNQKGDFVEYVYSNEENAYPDDGPEGNYYYEKVSDSDLPTGVRAVDFGTYTVASDFTTSSITIPHNLGEAPDFVLFYYPDGNIATTYSMLYSIRSNKLGFRSSAYNVYCGYHGNTTTSVTTSNSNGSGIGVNNLTATSFKVASYSTSYYWRGGYTYNWIAIKFS